MNFIQKFKDFLLLQKPAPSKVTVKNYVADVKHFISWYESFLSRSFQPEEVTFPLIQSFKQHTSSTYSARSIERHISSLRKFFHSLKLLGITSHSPFDQVELISSQKPQDPWHIKEFKDFLYVYNASHLTIKNYIIDVKQFLQWVERVTAGDHSLDSSSANLFSLLSGSMLEEYKLRLATEGGFSASSINRKLSSLRKYLGWANEQGLINQQIAIPDNTNAIIGTPITQGVSLPENAVNIYQNGSDGKYTGVIRDGNRAEAGLAEAEGGRLLENSGADEQQNSVRKVYSTFPPLRLTQKIGKGLDILIEATLIAPLAHAVALASRKVWALRGKPLFAKANKNLKIAASNPNWKLKIGHWEFSSVKNLPKEMYAPHAISLASFPWYRKIWHHARYTRPSWYRKYHQLAIAHYFNLAILLIFCTAIGFGMYNSFVAKPKETPTLAATAPPRILSFQGRLTDSSDTPITASTNLRFAIYSDATASGSSLLWQEVNGVSPDKNGVFSVLLGKGTSIPQSLFANNQSLYLGITVGQTAELTPRQQLATVAYATNSETLQGMAPITQSGAGTNNVILALNSSGNLSIGASTTFQSTSGQFTLAGNTVDLTTNAGTNGNITVAPDGSGLIDLQKPLQNSTLNNNIAPGLGAVEVDDLFAVLATSAASAVIVNQNGSGPLFTASTSGATKFAVGNGGDITSTNYTTAGGVIYANSSGLFLQTATGTAGQCLSSSGGGAPVWTNCTGGATNFWTLNSSQGTLAPINSTLDVFFGGTATSSANFAFLNNAPGSGTPTASIAGNLTLNSAGIIQTTKNQPLTIGGNSTGTIIFSPNNGTGSITVNGTFNSSLIPTTTNTFNLGSPSLQWNNVYTNNLFVNGQTITQLFQRNVGVISPINITDDLAIGGTATSTAKFQVFGLTGNATTAGTLTFDASGSIQTTRNQPLTIGGNSTGAITLSPNNGIGTVTITGLGTGVVQSTAGVLSTAAVNLTTEVTGILPIANGGTNNNTLGSAGTVLYSDGTKYNFTAVGGAGQCLTSNVSTAPSWSSCSAAAGASNFWTLDNGLGVLYPINSSLDLLVGGTSTTSANFAFINNAPGSGTPTASISGNLTLNSAGVIQTTKNQPLTIGGNSTGTIIFSPNNGTGIVTFNNPTITTTQSTLSLFNTTTTTLNFAGAATTLAIGNSAGTTTLNGNLALGTSNANTINPVGVFSGSLIPQSTSINLGSSTNYFGNAFITNLIPSSTSQYQGFFQRNSGVLSPFNTTDDLAIGGTATATAKFQIFGNTGNATSAGNLTFSSPGSIQTTSFQPLTLGGTTTGNILLSPNNGTGSITINGTFNSSLIPTATNTYNLGSPSLEWNNVYANSVVINGQAITQLFQRNGGVIAPIAVADDLAIGGASTASAAFQVFGSGTNVGTATTSGNISFRGTPGSQTVFQQNLLNGSQLGFYNSVGGDSGITAANPAFFIANSGKLGINTNSPSNFIDASYNINQATGFSISNTNAGTANQEFMQVSDNAGKQFDFREFGSNVSTTFTSYGGTFSLKSVGRLRQTGNGIVITTSTANPILFGTSDTERARIDANGNLAINTATPLGTLDVRDTSGTTPIATFSGKTSFAGVVVDNAGVGDLFTASTSGLPRFTIANTGNITATGSLTGVTNLSASGTINFSGLTASRLVTTDGSSNLATTISSANVAASVTDETGTGLLVFGTSPTITTSLVAGSASFDLLNTTATTINFGGAASAVAIGASASTVTFGNGGDATLTTGGNGNLALTSAGSGNTILSTDFNSGVYVGTTANTPAVLSVAGGIGSNASLIVNNNNSGDLFTASSSGVTKFIIGNSGTLTDKAYTTDGGLLYTNGSGVVAQTAQGLLGQCLTSSGGGAPTWQPCATGGAGTNWWTVASGALFPINSTFDVFAGGTSTASAKFSVLNMTGSGTPTASVSSGLNGTGTFITANGTLQTTNFSNLTLGGSTTGDIFLTPHNGSGNVTINGVSLDANTGGFTLLATPVSVNFATAATSLSIAAGTGTTTINNALAVNGSSLTTNKTSFDLLNTTATTINFGGGASTAINIGNASGTTTNAGSETVNGNVTLGVNNTKTLTVNALLNADLIPTGNGAINLGSATHFYNTVYANNFVAPVSGGTSGFWSLANDVIFPTNTFFDLAIGGTATSSATPWQVFSTTVGVNTAGTATSSGGLTFRGNTTNVNLLNGSILKVNTSVGGDGGTTTQLQLNNNGDLTLGGANIITTQSSLNLFNTTATTINFGGSATTGINLGNAAGSNVIRGNVTLGSAGTNTITPNGKFAASLIPTSTSIDLGSSTNNFGNLFATNIFLPTTNAYGGLWKQFNQVISPFTNTNDLAIGGDATGSAKFQIFGTSGNATSAGTLTFDTNGLIQTTRMQPLTLGSASTGPIQLSPKGTTGLYIDGNGNVGIGTTSPLANLDVNGNASISGNLTFNAAAATIQNVKNQPLAIGGNTTGFINLASNIQVNGNFLSSLIPNATDTYNLGSDPTAGGKEWDTLYVRQIISPVGGGIAGFWQLSNAGVLAPSNLTNDLAIGGNATASAKFQVFANNFTTDAGTVMAGTASMSGSLTFVGTPGSQTLFKNQILNGASLGFYPSVGGDLGATTPNLYLANSGKVGIGTSTPQGSLDVMSSTNMPSDLILNQTNATNLVPNPSFENASTFTSYTLSNTAQLTANNTATESGLFGSHALRFYNVGPSGTYTSTSSCIAVSASSTYTFSAYILRAGGFSGNTGIDVQTFTNGTCSAGQATAGRVNTTTTDQWSRLTTSISTAGISSVEVRFIVDGTATGRAYADGLQLEQASSASPYLDGSLGPGYFWTGVPNNSSSQRTFGADIAYQSINSAGGLGASSRGISPTLQLDQDGSGDLFVASASGTTKAILTNAGIFKTSLFQDLDDNRFFLDPAASATSLDVNGSGLFGTLTNPNTNILVASASATGFGILSSSNATLGASSGGGFLALAPQVPIAADQRLGLLAFGALTANGSTPQYSPAIAGFSSQAWNGTSAGGYLAFYTTPNGSLTQSERMRIDQTGNVGIGTTNPQIDLAVGTVGNGYYGLQKGDASPQAGYLRFGDNSGWKFIIGRAKESSGTSTINTTTTGSLVVFQDTGKVGIIGDDTAPFTPISYLTINQSATYNTTTPGTTAGAIHLRAEGGAANDSTAITFGAVDAGNKDAAQAGIYVQSSGSFGTKMYFATTNSYVTGAQVHMMIDNGGKVAIGNQSPGANSLRVVNSGAGNFSSTFTNNGNCTTCHGIRIGAGPNGATSSTSTVFVQFTGGDEANQLATITGQNATGVNYNTTSDIRIKQDIVSTHFSLDDLLKIQIKDFHFKSNPIGPLETGFIAQQLYTVFPDAVSLPTNPEDVSDTFNPLDIWGVDYGRVTPLIVKAVQDLNNKVDIATSSTQLQLDQLSSSTKNLTLYGDGLLGYMIVPATPSADFTVPSYYTLSDALGNPIKQISAISDAVIGNLRAGVVNTQQLFANSLVLTTTNISIAGQSLHDYIAGIVNEVMTSNNQQLATSGAKGSFGEIQTNLISPLASESAVALGFDNSGISVKNSISQNTVARIDNSGNATFSGQLASQSLAVNGDATVSGTLRAGRIEANTIAGLQAVVGTLSAQNITNVTNIYFATPSAGTVATNNITGSGSISNPSAGAPFMGYTNIASYSGFLSYVPNLNTDTAFFNQNLVSNGQTSLADTTISGQLAVGTQLIVADNAINVLGGTFQVQSLRQGDIAFEGGLIAIDTNGNLTVNGDAVFTKNLAANVITPLANDKDLLLKLGDNSTATGSGLATANLSVQNASGSGIFQVDQLGNLIASGAASIAKLNFPGVQPALAVSDTEVVATGSAGTAVIKAHQTEVTIDNPAVTAKSLIYITPVGQTSYSPYLLRQVSGKSFTVGIPLQMVTNTTFNWLIVN